MTDVRPNPELTFTFDLEDHRPTGEGRSKFDKSFVSATDRVLGYLEERDIKGTFFVVGELADSEPDLLKRVSNSGHEIACHSLDHTVLTRQTPQQFHHHSRTAKSKLEDVTGKPVTGYRAPVFSLIPQTKWAIDVLGELGFTYSSSTLPAGNPLHGFPGLPKQPFRWENGLLEIPVPTGQIFGVKLPHLGGIYFRYLPEFLINRLDERSKRHIGRWTYCHPYDFERGETYFRINGASHLVSILLWFKRHRNFEKFDRFVHRSGTQYAAPFETQINAGVFDGVQTTTG